MWNNQGGFQGYGGDQGGGGYMSPGAGGFGASQPDEKRARSRVQSIMPCTVAQILSATQTEDKFFSGPNEISQVTLVGLVRSVNETPTRLDYEVDDMTGPHLEVKQFVDNDDSVPDNEKVQALQENTYVRVCGHVRAFGGKRNIVAFKIVPIREMNELTCHILEVIHSSVALSKMHNQPDGGMANVNGSMKMETGYTNSNTNGGGMFNGLSQVQSQVHTAIRNTLTDQGISVEIVCKQLRGVPEKAVRDAIEFLSSEGHIYSTIDDEHYKATDS
ncbi:hypothetical protein CHS0354_024919 [Potamilus streckersoni]|uniref:Replication protein A C-terminal domain-containing protein n=1 Tax=Potamilus streckersoni TaxID=2493646 RepID=A0AAE0S4A1_9BIVA|nr:hypothetical protein CHS0354_024919 [Potamilus streckersoni]